MIIGYACTSTTDQTAGLAAQERDLRAAGAEKLFTEQVSSVTTRAVLAECLAFLRHGDVLMVSKPDQLARSTAELLTIEGDLTRRGIGLVVLSMGGERLDTRNPTSKLMLTILAGVATWEWEIMLERQREGIAKAKAEGKYKGRPASLDVDEVQRLRTAMGPARSPNSSAWLAAPSTGCWRKACRSRPEATLVIKPLAARMSYRRIKTIPSQSAGMAPRGPDSAVSGD